ncbi:unnamed protein product [Schistocephalus solidus]|uniref:Uncharacterized protein n=1 Tax=Schistocephalus solidus TaxID=70667 RepID=A0A183SXT0_SCHSO|nr:unnamed protein product [Schistocephalus solidus]
MNRLRKSSGGYSTEEDGGGDCGGGGDGSGGEGGGCILQEFDSPYVAISDAATYSGFILEYFCPQPSFFSVLDFPSSDLFDMNGQTDAEMATSQQFQKKKKKIKFNPMRRFHKRLMGSSMKKLDDPDPEESRRIDYNNVQGARQIAAKFRANTTANQTLEAPTAVSYRGMPCRGRSGWGALLEFLISIDDADDAIGGDDDGDQHHHHYHHQQQQQQQQQHQPHAS